MFVARLNQLLNTSRPALNHSRDVIQLANSPNCRFFSNNDDDDSKVRDSSKKYIEMVVTSLRVDRVAASGLGLARRKIDNSLLAGHVFLNGSKVTKKSRQVVDGDIIDRISEKQPNKKETKFGQVQVVNIGELTKKGNYHIGIVRNKALALPVEDFWKSHK